MNSSDKPAEVLWSPDPDRVGRGAMAAFAAARRQQGVELPPTGDGQLFAELHAWSIKHPTDFWEAIWRELGIVGDRGGGPAFEGSETCQPPSLGDSEWFGGAKLNFAENLLQWTGPEDAIIAWDERGEAARISRDELRRQVAAIVVAFRRMGVEPGDRVAGWLPNIPEAVIAMLAAASLGATWTSCSPDFGVEGVVDRFGQTNPVVLIFADGYRYGGKVHDCTDRAAELIRRLPSVRHSVMVKYLGEKEPALAVENWGDILAATTDKEPQFLRLPFNHPLYVMYSSGTTGLPKCLVHGAGGTLIQHLKEHRLHVDLRPDEKLFYFTTCGWMMWNWLVSGLAVGSPIVLYDGAAMPAGQPDLLWRMVDEVGVDVFGTSAKYLALAEKAGMNPRRNRELSRLRAVLSTGSPLTPESFDWCHSVLGAGVQVSSISGGTDIISCFVLGNPLQAVRRGEIQGPGLGMAVEVFDDVGQLVPTGTAGELVCTSPFPSMPVAFWNDLDGERYRSAYFSTWPGVWRHGDWSIRTASGGFMITGRSDATLNPGGVRIGTAEIYRQVEAIDEVVEGLVIGQRIPGSTSGDVRVVLFVRLREGVELDEPLERSIRQVIRSGASPHHVPKAILVVGDIPRTRSGKLSELAVRDVVEGREVKNIGALANPEALEEFRDRPELAV